MYAALDAGRLNAVSSSLAIAINTGANTPSDSNTQAAPQF